MTDSAIRAAGVVLWRPSSRGPQLLIVHRPRRKDWSLPKGKLDPGEHVVVAAVRETIEETGHTPILSAPLPRQRYRVLGRTKTVDYWLAQSDGKAPFVPDDEIDEVRWVTLGQAESMLTYARDFRLVNDALTRPATVPLIVLRHAAAMKRASYRGKVDARRPITGRGKKQAEAVAPLLAAYGIQRIHSSDSTRCLQTVAPFDRDSDADLVAEPTFSEERYDKKPGATRDRIEELAAIPEPIVVCSHRPVLPTLIKPFVAAGAKRATVTPALSPAELLVFHREFTKGRWRVVAVERHDVG